jgi:hypothetical protein
MPKVEYQTRPLIISERQLHKFIIDIQSCKRHITSVKDRIPYAPGNIIIHDRLSNARDILESIQTDLNYFLQL